MAVAILAGNVDRATNLHQMDFARKIRTGWLHHIRN